MVVPGRLTTTRTTLDRTSSMRSQPASPAAASAPTIRFSSAPGQRRLQLSHGICGVGGPSPLDLDPARLKSVHPFDGRFDKSQAFEGGGDRPARDLLPGLVCDHEENTVEAQLMAGVHRGDEMADVHGIEGPTEDADSQGAAHRRSVASGRTGPETALSRVRASRESPAFTPAYAGAVSTTSDSLNKDLVDGTSQFTPGMPASVRVKPRPGTRPPGAASRQPNSPHGLTRPPTRKSWQSSPSNHPSSSLAKPAGSPAPWRRSPTAEPFSSRPGTAPSRSTTSQPMDPRQAQGHLADGCGAHLRLGGPGRKARAHRRTVRQATLVAHRAGRLLGAARLPRAHNQRRRPDTSRTGAGPSPHARALTTSRPRR